MQRSSLQQPPPPLPSAPGSRISTAPGRTPQPVCRLRALPQLCLQLCCISMQTSVFAWISCCAGPPLLKSRRSGSTSRHHGKMGKGRGDQACVRVCTGGVWWLKWLQSPFPALLASDTSLSLVRRPGQPAWCTCACNACATPDNTHLGGRVCLGCIALLSPAAAHCRLHGMHWVANLCF